MHEYKKSSGINETLQLLKTAFPVCGNVSISPAERWDDGSVVGNGIQGALAFCKTRDEEIILSQEEMFLPLFPFFGYLPLKEHYETIRQLVVEGKADEAQQLIKQLKIEGNFPLYNTTDPFVGAAALDLKMQTDSEYSNYIRSTDFENGESLVAWQNTDGIFHRRFFVSRTDNVFVLQLSSPTDSKINISVGLREIEYVQEAHPKAQDIYSKTIDHCESKASGNILTHRMHFKRHWEDQPLFGSATIGRVVCHGGETNAIDNQIQVKKADKLLLIFRTIPEHNGSNFSLEEEIDALMEIDSDYNGLLSAHSAIHREIFNRCTLQLSGPQEQKVSSEELQASSDIGATNPALVEKAFAAGRFGIISSTGKMPPLLQGVWTGTWKPRWSGDYTLNGNVQSMVAASLCGNHYECQETLMDYLDSLMDDFRDNARELLGFRGPLIPWRSSTNGRTHYLSCFGYYHDFPGTYWFAGAGWFAQIYYDYYLYTGDEDFFENRLKPFLLDSVSLYEDFLTLEKDGKYIIAPDSSAENVTANNIWMAPNPTMTIAVIKQLLRTLIRLKDKLDVNEKRIKKWQTMLSKMPDYAIGNNGALKEWIWPGIENNEAHRHASHLYPLYYGVDPEIAKSTELQEACRVAIDKRMAFRRPEKGLDMAFGFTQLGMSAAYLGDNDLAYESLEYLVNSYWSPAMVSFHNVKDVFNLDISGGLPAVIITMLVQSFEPENSDDPWLIKILPCLPKEWPKGALNGVRSRGGFELDIIWENNKLTNLKVKSLRGEACKIEYGDKEINLHLKNGETRSICI